MLKNLFRSTGVEEPSSTPIYSDVWKFPPLSRKVWWLKISYLFMLLCHLNTNDQTWDSKMTWKFFIDMAASFWFFSSFLAKSISFYFRNQIYTALGFQKYSHCNKVLYISPWTIPFYTSDVSLLTKKSLIFAVFYTCESGVLLKYGRHFTKRLHSPLISWKLVTWC